MDHVLARCQSEALGRSLGEVTGGRSRDCAIGGGRHDLHRGAAVVESSCLERADQFVGVGNLGWRGGCADRGFKGSMLLGQQLAGLGRHQMALVHRRVRKAAVVGHIGRVGRAGQIVGGALAEVASDDHALERFAFADASAQRQGRGVQGFVAEVGDRLACLLELAK